MSVHKRPETNFWWYSIYRGPGKPRLRGSTGKADRSEAEAVEKVLRMAFAGKTPADRLHAMIDALVGSDVVGLPLAGVFGVYASWVNSTGRALAKKTMNERRRACERLADWASDEWPAVVTAGGVDRACAAGFASWLSKPSEKGKSRGGKARRNVIGNLGSVWEGLRRVRDDIFQNPWPLVLPENDSARLHPFSPAQVKNVLAVADTVGQGWGLACRIALYTGLRYGDVARLRWDSVDLDARLLRLRPSKTSRHAIQVVMPLCDALVDAFGTCPRSGAFLLPDIAAHYPLPRKGALVPFKDILTSAGVSGDRYTFHSWRHTFRTRLAEAGVSDEIAKRLGGWTVDATAMRYDHDGRLAELRAAVQRGASVGVSSDGVDGPR